MIFHNNAQFQKFTGAITCGADQFQCKSGICLYTNNSNCHGPCIHGDWANDGTNDCSDGSDEENFDYDYDDNDGNDYDDDDDFKAIVSGFDSVDLNTVEMPTSNTLKLKVINTAMESCKVIY